MSLGAHSKCRARYCLARARTAIDSEGQCRQPASSSAAQNRSGLTFECVLIFPTSDAQRGNSETTAETNRALWLSCTCHWELPYRIRYVRSQYVRRDGTNALRIPACRSILNAASLAAQARHTSVGEHGIRVCSTTSFGRSVPIDCLDVAL